MAVGVKSDSSGFIAAMSLDQNSFQLLHISRFSLNSYSLKNNTISWAYETFIETLQSFAEYELENNQEGATLPLFGTEPTYSISEPLCLTGRFIYECNSDSLKIKLKIIKENQTKPEIIAQIEKVEELDWQSRPADMLQFPIVGMNPLLFQDREIKELALSICPKAEYFYLRQNGDDSELLQFAIKNSFIYDMLPIHLKSNMAVIIPYVRRYFNEENVLSRIPQEVLKRRENVIKLSPYIFELLPEKDRDDPEVILFATKYNEKVIKSINPDLLTDISFVKQILNKNGKLILGMDESLLKDHRLVLLAINNWGKPFYKGDFEKLIVYFPNDNKIMLLAANIDIEFLEFANSEFLSSKKLMHSVIRNNGLALKYASKEIQNDKEMVLTAISNNRLSIQFASEKLKANQELVLAASNNDKVIVFKEKQYLLQFVSKELQNNKELVLNEVRIDGLSLQFASKDLKNDKEIAILAVSNNGEALEFVSNELKGDMELVINAVNNKGYAIKFASLELKNDKKLGLLSVGKHGASLKYLSKELQSDKEVVLTAVKNASSFALKHASKELKKDKDVLLAMYIASKEFI